HRRVDRTDSRGNLAAAARDHVGQSCGRGAPGPALARDVRHRAVAGMVRLTVTHDELEPGSDMERAITQRWPRVLSMPALFPAWRRVRRDRCELESARRDLGGRLAGTVRQTAGVSDAHGVALQVAVVRPLGLQRRLSGLVYAGGAGGEARAVQLHAPRSRRPRAGRPYHLLQGSVRRRVSHVFVL